MNNLTKKTDLSLIFLKKENSLRREKLQIRNFLVSSIIFTVFAIVCSLSVTNSIANQKLANNLQNKLSWSHIIALHAVGFGILFGGNFSDTKK